MDSDTHLVIAFNGVDPGQYDPELSNQMERASFVVDSISSQLSSVG